ncbi:hypothetical protein [Candidatus Pantoea deserta]|uniref:hypothetical protein n=1 Tax=Candidatus Pantoea deserta TaxID=1869313 RepID=UPI000F5125F9|nr:hypothetical protein [Pantoea deserta]
MNISQRYVLGKLRLGKDTNPLPPLFSGLKKIPLVMIFCWVAVVALQILMIEDSGGNSLASLLVFIVFTFLIIPVLTYMSVYAGSSSLIRSFVSKGKISKWTGRASKVLVSVLIFSFICMGLNVPYFSAYLFPVMAFIVLMIALWIKFRKEIKVLACARDFILLRIQQVHISHRAVMNEDNGYDINPVNGLPMFNSDIDVLGNPRGGASIFTDSDHSLSPIAPHSSEYATGLVNPSTGLPMLDSTYDVQGHAWGSTDDKF